MSSGFRAGVEFYSSPAKTHSNNLSVAIKKFDIDHNKANYLILGGFYYTLPLIKEIIGNTRSTIITFDKKRSYNQDTCLVTDNFDLIDLRAYIDAIKRDKEKGIHREHTYIVFDDCFDDDSWQSNKALIELLRDRNNIFNISVIIAISYPYLHNPYINNCIDYTIVLHDVCRRDLQRLYKLHFNFIDSYDLFKQLLTNLCSNRECCAVLINGEIDSRSIERCLKWYSMPQQLQQ